jgi:bifunctional ADP-heptose synthase (sugar kinase/adenylyltransferase)
VKVLVIGETCTDIFCYGSCSRLEPSAPVPVFKDMSKVLTLGMATLVANNLKSLGAEVDTITNDNYQDITKTRYVDNRTNHMFLRVDNNDSDFPKCNLDHVIETTDLTQYDAIVISDYDKGFLSEDDLECLLGLHPVTFIDTKKILGSWSYKAKFIKINSEEYKVSFNMIRPYHNKKLIVTLGTNGSRYDGTTYPVDAVGVKDVSGAGDTFLAALVAKYLENNNIVEAIKFANNCSTRVVQTRGITIL